MTLEEKFKEAKEKVMTLSEKPSNNVMLELYAFNKQAEVGEIDIDPPKRFDFVAQAKYNAWKSKSGVGKEEAMTKYIELVNSLFK